MIAFVIINIIFGIILKLNKLCYMILPSLIKLLCTNHFSSTVFLYIYIINKLST